jgi:hypothetical protein
MIVKVGTTVMKRKRPPLMQDTPSPSRPTSPPLYRLKEVFAAYTNADRRNRYRTKLGVIMMSVSVSLGVAASAAPGWFEFLLELRVSLLALDDVRLLAVLALVRERLVRPWQVPGCLPPRVVVRRHVMMTAQ